MTEITSGKDYPGSDRRVRPRVLEVLFSFRTGGSEVVGLELANQLRNIGVEVMCTAVDGMSGPLRAECARLELPVIDLGFPVRDILRRNGFSPSLTRRLRALRLDAIHLQHFLTLQKVGLASRMARVPRIVVTEHSDARLRDDLGQRLRLHLVWRLAHHITVVHSGMAQYLQQRFHVPASGITVVPNGIEIAQWHRRDRAERRAELGIGTEFTFVFVGRLEKVKNVPELIRAFLAAQPRFAAPARLLVVGNGSEMAKCAACLAGSPFAGAVTFLGEQKDIRRFLAAADAVVMNSLSEGMPRALIEAMCMGLPAIATGVGGIPVLLRDRGWLTRVGDRESLQAALLDAAAHPEKAAAFGERSRLFVASQYDYRDVVRRYREILMLPDSGATGRAPFVSG